jgi:hypothetical protein
MPKNQIEILQFSRRFSSLIFVKVDFARLRENTRDILIFVKIFKKAILFNSEQETNWLDIHWRNPDFTVKKSQLNLRHFQELQK